MKKLYFLTIVTLSLFSCNKDFLDKAPAATASVETLFKDADGLKLAVTGVYDGLQGNIYDGSFYFVEPHFDGVTEDAVLSYPWEGSYSALALGTISPTSGGIVSLKWNLGYRAIARANAVIANIDNPEISIPDDVRLKYKAEVRFLRGLIYSDLVTNYGDVPLLLKPVSVAEAKVPRTPKAQVLAAVIEDLDFAAQNLDVVPLNNEYGRATKQAALGIKTRVLLYQEDWAGAAAAAKAVMDLEPQGAVHLSSDYESLFNGKGNNDKEVLFSIQYLGITESRPDVGEGGMLAKHYGLKGVPRGQGWGSMSYQEAMFDAFYMKDGKPKDESPLYDPLSPYANRDPRFYWSFFIPGYSTWLGQPYTAANYAGYIPELSINTKKWVSESDVEGMLGSNTNFIIIRYADVLLMYAEAQNELNASPDNSVYSAINKIRERADMPDVESGLTKEEMREVIRHERKVELSQEGLRYHDLVRWGIAKEKINSNIRETRNWQEHNALLPIPQDERQANPSLTQNPGYPL